MPKKQTEQKKQENKSHSESLIIHDSSKISRDEKESVKENILQTVRNGAFEIELTEEEKQAPYHEVHYYNKKCPDGKCDGSGFIYETVNRKPVSHSCTCVQKTVMNRKLRNANFDQEFFDSTLESLHELEPLIKLNYFKTLDIPINRTEMMDKLFKTTNGKKKSGKTTKEYTPTDEEEVNLYIHRHYEVRKQSSISKFTTGYAKRLLKIYNENGDFHHLLLFGAPGKGKSYLACAIGRYFLENGKSVSYTKMESMMQILKKDMQENHPLIKSLESKDLVIFDELGGEYHKESGWALKQIQNLFKSRYEDNKPTIILTNLYPNELDEAYDEKIMSMFHGKFMIVQPYGDCNLRTYFGKRNIEDYDFID